MKGPWGIWIRTRKVLIYMSESSLKPTTGGPAGYLFNLKMGLSKMNVENVEFMRPENSKSKLKIVFDKFPLTVRISLSSVKTVFLFSQAVWKV